MRPAVEIARALPSLAGLSDETVSSAINGDYYKGLGWVHPSRGELAVLWFADAAERMLNACDAETIGAALERLDRVREAMRPPTPEHAPSPAAAPPATPPTPTTSVRDLMANLEASLAAAKARRP